jgi:DNA mismatch repair ATPase MutS
MKFELDEQTLGDLGIYQNGYDGNSILQLFNKTITFGGTDKLRDIDGCRRD